MANSSRRYLDSNGNQFMPMNMEGGTWNEGFITTPKLITIGAILFSLVMIFALFLDRHPSIITIIVDLGLWAFLSSLALRFIVFEEKFYYRMYKQLKGNEITTPAMFWNIASISNTSNGAILTYSDTKIGIIVRLERDTITGKNSEFKEIHYDSISDFYRELTRNRYQFVQMNIMEKAGNDPRLENLDPLIHKNDNENICKLMEKEIGYIKSITHNTLYESDYILVYTNELTKMDTIIDDTVECIHKILEGAYIDYRILDSRDIIELVKELYGVKYFNYTQATLDMYKLNGSRITKVFDIIALEDNDNKFIELDNVQRNKINNLTSRILNGSLDADKVSFKEAIVKKVNKEINQGVNIDEIEKGVFRNAKAPIRNQQDKQQRVPQTQANLNKSNMNSTGNTGGTGNTDGTGNTGGTGNIGGIKFKKPQKLPLNNRNTNQNKLMIDINNQDLSDFEDFPDEELDL